MKAIGQNLAFSLAVLAVAVLLTIGGVLTPSPAGCCTNCPRSP